MPQPTLSYQQLTAVAAEFGTPVYVYDANYITHQYQQLTAAFAQSDTRFFYACKALTNIAVLQHISAAMWIAVLSMK